MPTPAHVPVLADHVLSLLRPQPGQTIVDLTLGLGGHAELLAQRVGPTGRVIGFDRDAANLARAVPRIQATGVPCVGVHGAFTEAADWLQESQSRADIVLADLGFSSNQMDDPARGLSFTADGPLDMRLDQSRGPTAADLLDRLSERELADLIYRLGEDPFARRIAQKLAQIQRTQPIRTTARLAEAVVEAYGSRARASRMHPATRTFMALRIAVNDELGQLQRLLEQVAHGAQRIDRGGWLSRGARVAIISFHSLEDRLVKRAFAAIVDGGHASRLTRKPLTADAHETDANPRARSAKLRAIVVGVGGNAV